MPDIHIRTAMAADLVAINDIYNHYVLNSTCTYQEEPESIDARRQWFHSHGDAHPVIVALMGDEVIGWGSLSAYHSRSAYRYTVENSVYVHPQRQRRGAGALLLQELLNRATSIGHRVIIAGIDAEQPGSIALHAQHGFVEIGRMQQVGYKFGRWLDVIYMELVIDNHADRY